MNDDFLVYSLVAFYLVHVCTITTNLPTPDIEDAEKNILSSINTTKSGRKKMPTMHNFANQY